MRYINLQLFAEPAPVVPTPTPSPTPAPAAPEGQPAAAASVDDKLMDLFSEAKKEPPAPAAEPPATPQPEVPPTSEQLLAGRFKTPGELVSGYQNLQTDYTKKSQALSDIAKSNEQLQARITELEGKLTPPTPQPADEFEGLDSEAFLEKLYADPQGVLKKFAENITKKAIEPYVNGPLKPVIEQQQLVDNWGKAIDEMVESGLDIQGNLVEMRKYIADNHLENSSEPRKVLMTALVEATRKAAAVDPKTLLADKEWVEKNVLSNEEIKNAFLKAHMESLSGNKIPPVIAGPGSGQPLATPLPSKPKTMEEGMAQFESMIMGNFVK